MMTPLEIDRILYDISKGNAEISDVRQLLEDFCLSVDQGRQPSKKLTEYLAGSFRQFLDNERPTVDACLGLKKSRGAPRIDDVKHIEIAREVLRLLLEGKSLEAASFAVADKMKCSERKVTAAWSRNRVDAVAWLQLDRDGRKWTAVETTCLCKILKIRSS